MSRNEPPSNLITLFNQKKYDIELDFRGLIFDAYDFKKQEVCKHWIDAAQSGSVVKELLIYSPSKDTMHAAKNAFLAVGRKYNIKLSTKTVYGHPDYTVRIKLD